jgi:HEPN domain-containing protein
MRRATREWIRKAEADHRVALGLDSGIVQAVSDQVCFHCQQSAEKYLKAILEELAQPIPKTHDLLFLFGLVQSHFPLVTGLRRGLATLTRYGVVTRYPGFSASRRQAAAAMRWSERVRRVCRTVLGLRT